MREIRLIDLRLHRDYSSLLRQSSQAMADAFDALAEQSQGAEIEVILPCTARDDRLSETMHHICIATRI